MATSIQMLISDSLRLLGVIAEAETATAEQTDICLRTMNELAEQWDEHWGIDVGWQTRPSVNDDVPLRAGDVLAVKYQLALNIAPLMGAPIPAAVAVRAEQLWHSLIVKYEVTKPPEASMVGIPLGSAYYTSRGVYNIDTGDFD